MNKIQKKWRELPITLKVSLAYAICSVLQKGMSYVTTSIFARLLSKEQFGQAMVYSSWMGIFSIILTLNIAYGSFSKAMIKYEEDRDGYMSAGEGICLVLSGLFFLIYLPFQNYWNTLFRLPTYIIVLMVLEIIGSTGILLWSGKKRFEYKYIGVVIVTLAISIITPLVQLVLILNFEERGYAKIAGGAIVNFVIGFAFVLYNMIRGKKVFYKEYWTYALKFNIPLLAYYLSQVVFNQSDRIMIEHMLGEDKAADYGVAYSLATVLTFVLNAINNSYVPWFYGKLKSGHEEENRRISQGIAILMAVLLSGIIWFTPEIITLWVGSKYKESFYAVPPVAASILLLLYAQFFINVEFYYEEKKSLVYASLGAAIVNLVLNWYFIPRFGFVAAAYTTLISYILFALCNYFSMRKILKKRKLKDNAYNYKNLLLLFLVFGIVAIVGTLCYPLVWVRVGVLLVMLIVLFVKRKAVKSYLVRILKRNE